ncbi:MAG TPA: DUF416 family protein [Psychromonas hadalis]|nr:DUF416 family protein [Psychromonas hadalis]
MISLSINEQLKDLQAWQQSVFCMALSEQSRLHFKMFCDVVENDNAPLVDNFNQMFWDKMTLKGTKINFDIQQEHFDVLIPDARNFDFYGVYPAVDHCVILSCAFNSFLTKSKDEALNASQTAFSSIASFIELQRDEEIDVQTLKTDELFVDQLTFQTQLLKLLDDQRSPDLIKSIKKFVQDQGVTSLGIALAD